MTHNLGRLVHSGQTLNQSGGLDFVPGPGPLGGPRFVLLHFTNVNLASGAHLTVDLGYGIDSFSAGAGPDVWSRPIDPSLGPIRIRITGGSGSALLLEYGSGEPTIAGSAPGTSESSRSNPDPFFQTNPYEDPIFETRLECNAGFAWRNAACSLPTITDAVRNRVAAATGIIFEVHDGHVSSCSGTLIGADLFVTARHCLTDPARADQRSASVTFDYQTLCNGAKPSGHAPRFYKVLEEVASGSPPSGVNPPAADDWVVLRLDAAPGSLPQPLELRDAALMVGETILTMHHPNGASKRTQEGVHDGGSISGFDFAGGSSGSALFDSSGRVVGGPLSSGAGCGVTYAPVAPIKAALGVPPAPPAPADVVLVFDRSGSMGNTAPPIGRTKLEEAQDAAALFVQLVREGAGDRLGLVTFSSSASADEPLTLAAAAKTALVGPAPFVTGEIGGISEGGSTSLGHGVQVALSQYDMSSPNDRAILLFTDGLENTPPMVADVEGSLGSATLNVIGFGSDADIDSSLLNRVSREHGGQFTRALDGMALRKFFGMSFGNIFESGAISDPEFLLRAEQEQSEPYAFEVCGEERVTVVVGWDDPETPLRAKVFTPDGKQVGGRRVTEVRGRSWVFWRIPLPYGQERDGTWNVVVDRVVSGDVEFQPRPTDAQYFCLVICSGGPKLIPVASRKRIYTGDTVDLLVALHYPDRTTPHHAEVNVAIDVPEVSLGQLTMEAGLRAPLTSGDAVDAFHATLQLVARQAGGTLPVPTSTIEIPLFDDASHSDGAMEPDGIFNNPQSDIARVEGTYQFRARARYGEGCRATREATWAVFVNIGIDPDRSEVTVVDVDDHPDGWSGTIVIVPRDRYGNPVGPGRANQFVVSPIAGTRLTGNVHDRGDGGYAIDVMWDGSIAATPGVLVVQPDRDPVLLAPPSSSVPESDCPNCIDAANTLIDCLGIKDPRVKRVKVRRISVDIDLRDKPTRSKKDC